MYRLSFFLIITIFCHQALYAGFENTTTGIAENVYKAKAKALYERVKTENRYIDKLDFSALYTLPMGITKTLAGIEYTIIIDSIEITENGGRLLAYMWFQIPGRDQPIAFRGSNIEFGPGGVGANAKLMLVSNENVELGKKMNLILKAGTNVQMDCNGFKGLEILGSVVLDSSLAVREKTDGTLDLQTPVRADFTVSMARWGELLAVISLPPFQIRALPHFTFTVNNAVIDASEVANAAAMTFPAGYQSPFTGDPLWQGLYIQEFTVKLPKQLKSTDNVRTSFTASRMLVDNMGVSGNFSGKYLLTLEKGKIAKWAFSVDSIGVSLAAGTLQQAGFKGKIKMPIGDRSESMFYKAIISHGGNFAFTVTTTGEINIPLWVAKARLLPNSSLEIVKQNDEFLPAANLHGSISLSPGGQGKTSLANLSFQDLRIQSVAPVLSAGAFGFTSSVQPKTLGFPVTIRNIGFESRQNDAAIKFQVLVNFVGEGDGGFAGIADMKVWGTEMSNLPITYWQFKSLELSSINVNIDGGAYKIVGGINVYNEDRVFGNGFKGMVEATFTPGIVVKASAQFGNVNGYRYWYADALMGIPGGIPVFPGFAFYGFSGGAFYHMRQSVMRSNDLTTLGGVTMDNSTLPGRSLSGISYVPDGNAGLGLRAGVLIGTHPAPDAFNGDISLEFAFSTAGALNEITLQGNGNFLTPMAQKAKKSSVRVSVYINYDFTNTTLYGNLSTQINVAGGLIKGTGPDDLAGVATIYFSPSKWYVYIGEPDIEKRFGIKFADFLTINAYMVMGTIIPDMPPPPAEVLNALNIPYSATRDATSTLQGGGFAFGASAAFSSGDLRFLMFYASFAANLGFDVMLKNYGPDVKCDGSSSAIGINGWYAKGQTYLYIQGKVGISVDLAFYKGDYDILAITAAALFQAQLPNPTWIKGTVGGNFNILGGLVSGSCRFEVEVGEKCTISNSNVLSGVKMIAALSPESNTTGVDVFTTPQATFTMPIEKIFEIVDINENKRSFRARLGYFRITNSSDANIGGTQKWNSQNDVVAFGPTDILPSQTQLKLQVQVFFEERINGAWQRVSIDNKEVVETKEITFTTGIAPDYIPENNVSYTYPIKNQYNYYQKETSQGFIQLKQGQPDLFVPNPRWNMVGRFTAGTTNFAASYTYDNTSRQVKIILPNTMPNRTIIQWQLLKVPAVAAKAVDENVSGKEEKLSVTTDTVRGAGNNATLHSKKVDGTIDELKEKSIYGSAFRTSAYNTFAKKWEGIGQTNTWNVSVMNGVDRIGTNISGVEMFDIFELEGGNAFNRLVEFEAYIDNSWLRDRVIPLNYSAYGTANGQGLGITSRQPEVLGVPPLKALYFNQYNNNLSLENYPDPATDTKFVYSALVYNLVEVAYRDYLDLQQGVARLNTRGTYANNLWTTPFPNILIGNYKIKVKYMLPGKTTANSVVENIQLNYR